ncbi:MAG: protein kinase [Pirellulales bacterium]
MAESNNNDSPPAARPSAGPSARDPSANEPSSSDPSASDPAVTACYPGAESERTAERMEGAIAESERTLEHTPGAGPASAARAVPRQVGDYLLLEELGRGGMGIVYKARQRSLNRVVALKMIRHQESASPAELQRFQIEAEAAANLRHPGIVSVYEVGQDDGCQFYSMEFLAGRDLAQVTRDHSLPAPQAAQYLLQLAQAMQYAHEQGILHRDLKPSNVLVDEQDNLKITDFGLAKRLHTDSQLTTADLILGTPSYMPPEQAMPARGPVSPLSDVYSLGAILYHLLTCRPPFRAESALETIRQVLDLDPISPRVLNPRIPRDLATICLKCLEKDPQRRYSSAGELADELQRFLRGEPILARPLGRLARLVRWCRRHPVESVLALVIVVSVACGSAGVVWQWQRAERNLQRAERGFTLLSQASDEMLEVVEDWATRVPPHAAGHEGKLAATLDLYSTFLQAEPANTAARVKFAETHHRVGDVRRSLRQLDLAAQHYRAASDEYRRLTHAAPQSLEWPRRWADELDWLGEVHREAERLDEASRAFAAALQIQQDLQRREATPELSAEMARTLYNRALLSLHTGESAAAQRDLEQARQLLETALHDQPQHRSWRQGWARCRLNQGIVWKQQKEPRRAWEEYRAAGECLRELVAESPQDGEYRAELAQAQLNLGNLLLIERDQSFVAGQANLVAAQEAYEEAVRLLAGLVGEFPNIPDYRNQLANALNGLGGVHQVAGRKDDARQALERARDGFESLLQDTSGSPELHSRLALTYANLALLTTRDQLPQKIERLRQAVEHQSRAAEGNRDSTAYPQFLRQHRLALARALAQGGNYREAAEQAEASAGGAAWTAKEGRSAAEILVRAMVSAQRDSTLAAPERDACVQDLAQRSLRILQSLVRHKLVTPPTLLEDADLAPLWTVIPGNRLSAEGEAAGR